MVLLDEFQYSSNGCMPNGLFSAPCCSPLMTEEDGQQFARFEEFDEESSRVKQVQQGS
jgi:hypothetical protein